MLQLTKCSTPEGKGRPAQGCLWVPAVELNFFQNGQTAVDSPFFSKPAVQDDCMLLDSRKPVLTTD